MWQSAIDKQNSISNLISNFRNKNNNFKAC